MWESLKILGDLLTKGLPLVKSLATRSRDKKLRDIGYNLFMVYCRGNEVLITGTRILTLLDRFSAVSDEMIPHYVKNRNEWHDDMGFGSYSANDYVGVNLSKLLWCQAMNLDQLCVLLARLSQKLTIVDAQFYRGSLSRFRPFLIP